MGVIEENPVSKPYYGNWVSLKRIRQTFTVFMAFAAAAALLFVFGPQNAGIIVLEALTVFICALSLAAAIYFIYTRKLLSPEGADIQNKITALVLDHIKWNGEGKALDIGCGSGALVVSIAKRFPEARVTGADYWGGSWEYAKRQCEKNAALEGVAERTDFVQASASKLPFADGAFDLVVSNLTFHEVKDARDKRLLLKEALRAVKPGGYFVLQDLFNIRPYFGEIDGLLALMREWGAREVFFEDTSKSIFIPRALKLAFMAGTIGMIYGRKMIP